MASTELLCFLFVCFFALGKAKYCLKSSDCSALESCRADNVCRQRCHYCSYDHQCGTSEQCCDNKCTSSSSSCFCANKYECGLGKKCCKNKCIRESSSCSCTYDFQCGIGEECCRGVCSSNCGLSSGTIAGIIISNIVFFAFVICTVSCLCCASCPYYRYRASGDVIVTQQPQQQLVPTQAHTMTTQQVQAPLLHNYNQPSPAGYNQPPSGLHQAPPAYSPPIPNLNPSAEIKGQAVWIPPPEPAKY